MSLGAVVQVASVWGGERSYQLQLLLLLLVL